MFLAQASVRVPGRSRRTTECTTDEPDRPHGSLTGRRGSTAGSTAWRRLLEPADDGYEAALIVWNGMIDRRPVLIACCAFGAGVQRVPASATAFGDRTAPYMLSLDAIWSDPVEDAANISWMRNSWTDMKRHATGRMYLNFPGHGEGEDLVRSALGPEIHALLAKVKRAYDPGNLFRMNQNVLPEE